MNELALLQVKSHGIIAVSGGVDSMVLLHRLHVERPDLQLTVVHVNHHVRSDSDEDERLVREFCSTRNIPFQAHSLEPPKNGNIEEWGRKERYALLEKTLEDQEADWIATAHHLNDDMETFLLHLNRGTRLKGLCGMPAQRGRVIRPLLQTSKQELIEYAARNAVPYRQDSTNQDDTLKRNAVRHQVLAPMLEIFPHFPEQWIKLKTYLESLQACLHTEAQKFLSQQEPNQIEKKTYRRLAYPVRAQILEEWYQKTTGEKVHHEDQIKRWDHAILFWGNNKKTEWGQSPKPSFLIVEKTHVKIE